MHIDDNNLSSYTSIVKDKLNEVFTSGYFEGIGSNPIQNLSFNRNENTKKLLFTLEATDDFFRYSRINFSPMADPTANFGSLFGLAANQFFDAKTHLPDYQHILRADQVEGTKTISVQGNHIPELHDFNYILIRTPNIYVRSQQSNSGDIANHHANIFAKVPIKNPMIAQTYDSTWFPNHRVEINLLELIQFNFQYFNGSIPNFHRENISMVLAVDYLG